MTQPEPNHDVVDVRWAIPKNVWAILLSWGLAVVLLAGLFAYWQGREAANERRHNREQDRAMCELVTALQGGPTPPPGPAGDRARELIPKIEAVRKATCE